MQVRQRRIPTKRERQGEEEEGEEEEEEGEREKGEGERVRERKDGEGKRGERGREDRKKYTLTGTQGTREMMRCTCHAVFSHLQWESEASRSVESSLPSGQ